MLFVIKLIHDRCVPYIASVGVRTSDPADARKFSTPADLAVHARSVGLAEGSYEAERVDEAALERTTAERHERMMGYRAAAADRRAGASS